MSLADLLAQVDKRRLESLVRRLEGPRHPRAAPAALAEAESLVVEELSASGLATERQPFSFRGELYSNVVGTLPGADPDLPALLVGAHFDSTAGTPGADDNASGVAVLLEVARLAAGLAPRCRLEFVGFNLEELQDLRATFRVGSTRFARQARREGRRYAGVLVLEMVGYTDGRPHSQAVPPFVFKRVPRTGTFLAAVGDGRSRGLLREFERSAGRHVPGLTVVTYATRLRGYTLPLTRLSDNASFWDQKYPALMITDTAFLRNPHYHRASDRTETLDFEFMAATARAVLASLSSLSAIE